MFDAPQKVAALMRDFESPWMIAGGWALDLYLGRETRPHADVEIAVWRRDQLALQQHFAGYTMKKAAGGELSDWPRGESLKLPVHEIHLFERGGEKAVLEILLNETDGRNWLYRRNPAVAKPLAEVRLDACDGLGFLCPEIVLLYKSKAPRPQDEADFSAAVERLGASRRDWLKRALAMCDKRHRWLERL